MIKTNSKKAVENIRVYIIAHYAPETYNLPETDNFNEAAKNIYEVFQREKYYSTQYIVKHRMTELEVFVEWCEGLPSIFDTCYYYNRSAIDDLGELLEESETERHRFTEAQAEELLTRLIYREIIKVCKTH